MAAMRQGENRLERGLDTFSMGQEVAKENGWDFNWELVIEEDVHHSGSSILRAPEMAESLYFDLPAPSRPPHDITPTGSTIAEDAEAGAVIGRISARDPDGDDLGFAVSGDPRLAIHDADRLVVAEGADLSDKGDRSISLTLTARDGRAARPHPAPR